VKAIKKKEYSPFPPAQQPRKEDIAMETGEYFLSEAEKQQKKKETVKPKSAEKMNAKKMDRMKAFVAPKV